MIDRKKIARKGIYAAFKMRRASGINSNQSMDVFEFANNHGVDVRFENISSMEGLFSKNPKPVILLNSERPQGRQRFTCAHEFGHHVFGHFLQVDEILDEVTSTNYYNPGEFICDCFAGALLMPSPVIRLGFNIRGWEISEVKSQEVFVVAGWLGVSYKALIKQINITYSLLSDKRASALLSIKPKEIREELIGDYPNHHLIIVDRFWNGRPIDIQASDLVLVPSSTIIESKCVKIVAELKNGILLEGILPGIGRISDKSNEWSVFIRVCRKDYKGIAKYRYLEEPNSD